MKALFMSTAFIISSLAVAAGGSSSRRSSTRSSETYQNQNHVRDTHRVPASSDSLHRHTTDNIDPDMSTRRRSQAPMTNQIEGTRETSPTGDPTVQKE